MSKKKKEFVIPRKTIGVLDEDIIPLSTTVKYNINLNKDNNGYIPQTFRNTPVIIALLSFLFSLTFVLVDVFVPNIFLIIGADILSGICIISSLYAIYSLRKKIKPLVRRKDQQEALEFRAMTYILSFLIVIAASFILSFAGIYSMIFLVISLCVIIGVSTYFIFNNRDLLRKDLH